MHLVLWPNAAGFLHRAEPFCVADDARHHLPYALALAARNGTTDPCFFTTIESGGQILAIGVRLGLNLIISPTAGAELTETPVLGELAEIVRVAAPDIPGVLAPPAVARTFAVAWEQQTGQPWRLTLRERSFALTAVTPLPHPPGRLRVATTADRDLIVPWLIGMHADIHLDEPFNAEAVAERRLFPPDAPGDPMRALYLWENEHGAPRSMAGVQAQTAVGVRIGAVYTPLRFRRQGYARAIVAALSQAMLDLGRTACYLFTDLANPTSNRIYQEIGYRPVFDADEIRFA